MKLDKLKESWPIFLILVGAFVFIGVSIAQKNSTQETVSFTEIFPEEELTPATPAPEVIKEAKKIIAETADTMAAQETEDPVPAPAIVAEPLADEPGKYSIQVYSFKDKTRANLALEKIKSKGYPAYVLTSNLGEKGIWHRVRVGSYQSESQAKTTLAELKKEYNSGIIVKK